MSDITGQRNMIQQEETAAQAATSESTFTRMGASVNFINTKHVYHESFKLNGAYNSILTPYFLADGYISYPFPFEIVDLQLFSGEQNGTGGTLEIDVKWRPENSGSFASICSVTPKFAGGSTQYNSTRIGVAPSGFTAPVLSKSTFAAHDQLKLDVLQVPSGDVSNFEVKIFIRPIST